MTPAQRKALLALAQQVNAIQAELVALLSEDEDPRPEDPQTVLVDQEFAGASCFSKRSYRTREAAGQAAAHIREKRPGTEELRIYDCRICGGHHLTKAKLPPTREEQAWEAGK